MAKNKEIIFIIAGILIVLLMAGVFIYSINFLMNNLKKSMSDSVQTQSVVKFNLNALKDAGIEK